MLALVALTDAVLLAGGGRALAQEDSWEQITDMPTPRRLLTAATDGDNLYTFGGCGSPCFGPPFHTSADEETTVEVYLPQARRWVVKGRMPTILFGAAAAASDDGKIYTFGGYVSGNVVQEYDPAADSWKLKRPMPTPRFGLAAVALDKKVYVLGGSGPSGALEIYDPETDTWELGLPMPTPRVFLAAAAVGGKIYAIGGSPDCCGDSQTAIVEIYDPATKQWTAGAPLPIAQQVSAAVEANGKIYAFGGFIPGSGVQGNTFEYDPEANEWTSKTPMLRARDQAPAVLLNGIAYVTGGSVNCHCQALSRLDGYTPLDPPEVDITKTDHEEQVCPGDRLNYEINLENTGSVPILQADVTDFPARLNLVSATCESSGGATCSAGLSGNVLGRVNLPVNGQVEYTVEAIVAPGAAGDVSNRACVEVGDGEVCSEPDIDRVLTNCVTISKTDDRAAVSPGEEITYRIVVSNGSGGAVQATVTDEIDETGLIDFRWCLGDECEPSTNINEVVSVPAGGTRTFIVTGTVPCGVTTLTNTACLTVSGQPTRCASDTDTVLPALPKLRIEKSGPESVRAGETASYQIKVFNDGACSVCGATLNDPAPPGLQFVPSPGLCGTGFPCSLACLAPEASSTINASFQVPCEHSCPGAFTNTASITGAASAEVTTRVECPMIDLAISKDDGQDFADVLSDLTYTLKIRNNSQCEAVDALVTDKLPEELLEPRCIGENRSDCMISSERDLSIRLDVPGHSERIYQVQGKLGLQCVDPLFNQATVTDPEGGVDPDLANNADDDTTAVFPGLGVSIFCSGSTVAFEGGAVSFTFVLINGGPANQADNPGDELVDTLPAGLTLVGAAASSGTVTTLGNTVFWNGSIAVCDTVTITVEATVDAGTAGMTLCNPGTVFFDADGDGTNESSTSSDSCCVRILPAALVPAAGTLGLAALALLLATLSLWRLRRPSAGRAP
ncbi:MAG TPA: hypothetical protein VN493_02100 [Thermoanaerobaculia bacterium]|nr:hypothetical protein [Thermoanaerobaculia bacterium]